MKKSGLKYGVSVEGKQRLRKDSIINENEVNEKTNVRFARCIVHRILCFQDSQ